jgi:hypothetical protein
MIALLSLLLLFITRRSFNEKTRLNEPVDRSAGALLIEVLHKDRCLWLRTTNRVENQAVNGNFRQVPVFVIGTVLSLGLVCHRLTPLLV